MPAAAVIPAPIAYIKVVAVKKLVVGFLALRSLARHPSGAVFCRLVAAISSEKPVCPSLGWAGDSDRLL